MIIKTLSGFTSFDSAYTVSDYPWGFRLRTQRKYWIETNKKLGDRGVFSTLDPRTNKWCKPKKGTYYAVKVMYLDELNHVQFTSCHKSDSKEEADNFIKRIGNTEKLSIEQKNQLRHIYAFNKAMEGVTFECKVTSHAIINLGDRSSENIAKMEALTKEQEQDKAEQDKILGYIGHKTAEAYKTIEI